MAAGVALGIVAPGFARQLSPVSRVFLQLIRSIIAPLIFATLVVGIAGGGDMKRMGRIGGKAILYFEIVTTLALLLGLAAVNLVRPGAGISIHGSAAEAAIPQTQTTFSSVLEHIFPSSIIDAMARNDALQIVVFAFLFGAACAAIGAKAEPVVKFCASLAEVMFRYTRYVMYLAPLGVGAALAVVDRKQGRGCAVRSRQADRHHVRLVDSLHRVRARPGPRPVPHSGRRVLSRRARAVPDRLLHRLERSRAAAGARKHGAVRRAQAHRGLRDSHRLQLQPGGQRALPLAGRRLRGAGGGRHISHSAPSYS